MASRAVVFPCYICLALVGAFQSAAADNIPQYALTPEKTVYCPGEPVALVLRIANAGNEEIVVDLGADGVGAFTFQILDEKGNAVTPYRSARNVMYGLAAKSGRVKVLPKGFANEKLILNRWCSTILPAGRYEIAGRIQSHPLELQEIRTSLVIVAPDPEVLENVLGNIWETGIRGGAAEERQFAREMICYCQSPSSARYKMSIALTSRLTRDVDAATEGLAGIGDMQAVRYLIALAEDNALLEQVRRGAIEALYRIREDGNVAILEATADVVNRFQRPGRRVVGD